MVGRCMTLQEPDNWRAHAVLRTCPNCGDSSFYWTCVSCYLKSIADDE
jgi:predicted RNA-binding Zn-ribbon protein involved in translation (DUF1610 family)